MNQLTDAETFTQTSDEPYLRHHYRLFCSNGQVFEYNNHYDLMQAWARLPYDVDSFIEVIDAEKGFK